jgi:hypothetical protein
MLHINTGYCNFNHLLKLSELTTIWSRISLFYMIQKLNTLTQNNVLLYRDHNFI